MQSTIDPAFAAEPSGNHALLRTALRLDAVASAALGIVLAAASGPLSAPFGLPPGLLLAAGLALLPFAAVVGWLGFRARPPRAGVRAIVAVNALWVVGGLLMLVAGWVAPTPLGTAAVLAQALAVAIFAALQAVGLRRAAAPG